MYVCLLTWFSMLILKHNQNQGFTIIDFLCHLFLIGILMIGGPLCLSSNNPGGNNGYRIRTILVLRGR